LDGSSWYRQGRGAHCQIRRVFEGTRPGRSSSIGSKFEKKFPLFAALFGYRPHNVNKKLTMVEAVSSSALAGENLGFGKRSFRLGRVTKTYLENVLVKWKASKRLQKNAETHPPTTSGATAAPNIAVHWHGMLLRRRRRNKAPGLARMKQAWTVDKAR